MHRNENFRKMAKVFIIAFLCSEMQSSFTQQNSMQNRLKNYPSFINGTEAIQENSKYQASIRLMAQDYIFGEGHICGGAIIASSVVLTAAHCVFNYGKNSARHPSELRVVMGTVNRYQRSSNTLIYGVTHIFAPKTFDAQTLKDNIAIIMLERDIPEEHLAVQPISWNMQQLPDEAGVVSAGTFEVTSWGSTTQNVPIKQLLSLNSSKLSDQSCLDNYGGSLYVPVSMLCIGFGDSKMSVYPEDAGAPLLYNNRLVGISSFGHDSGIKVFPAVYTNVAHHSKWILDKIGTGSNQNSSVWATLGFLLFTAFTLKTANLMKF